MERDALLANGKLKEAIWRAQVLSQETDNPQDLFGLVQLQVSKGNISAALDTAHELKSRTDLPAEDRVAMSHFFPYRRQSTFA